ncbi:ankycorbin [Aricia agestis]|uniref:ankycorbin n=1 Tax=Aricia agestis TaxID=91739 RepID=UPI001C20AC27|nr:ankycorbin [Aricia agestis]
MERRGESGRGEPIPSILKKSKKNRTDDLLDKSAKIKRERNIGKKGDVNVPLAQGCTPLMYACQQADYNTVVEILNADPSSVRVRDRGLRSALHYCASSGAGASGAARAACADRVLMAAPALADARDADGLTPLHLAVVHGNVPLVQALLAAGADVNAQDDEQHTVVHWATVCGEVGALRAVLAAGAESATPDQHGGYPLHYAAQMCGAPAATDHQSRGAALEVLRALVKEGRARVDVRDADGRTPLLWAASAGSAAAVLALHQTGANVEDADRDGLTALHCAAARGHTEALETLVGLCGARVDVADTHGCTPLHYAAALGHADATSALLEHGADAHRQDRRGRSPAHTAAAKGQIETVRILGANGANLWLRNSKGDLPLHEAVASGRRELVKWLLDGRPSQVNATNHEGRTPLHIAAATDNADLCRLLLDRGAEVNPVARSSKNETLTPLDCATCRGHRSTAKYLQMHGGLPATKLTNAHIVIDGAPITGLPTRKVTSTKIDVRDRIRIEKREVVELSSPNQDKKILSHLHSDSDSNSTSSNAEIRRRRSNKKYSERRKEFSRKQKSLSDGHDSEIERCAVRSKHKHRRSTSKSKSRSRSEPSRKKRSSSKYRQRRYSSTETSSETSSNKETKRRRYRKHKRRSSLSSDSSLDSNERKNTKRKGKKTSIHIENDDLKQTVNIVKYKELESPNLMESKMNVKEDGNISPNVSQEASEDKNKLLKSKTQSETETDTLSVKTNMVVTEAEIHMERESSQHGNSELNVKLDPFNNVSIETVNLSVTHKDLSENKNEKETNGMENDVKLQSEDIKIIDKKISFDSAKSNAESKEMVEPEVLKENNTLEAQGSKENSEKDDDTKKEIESEAKDESEEKNIADANNEALDNDGKETLDAREKNRSFQVLSGPDSIENVKEMPSSSQELDKTPSLLEKENLDTQYKSSPSVSFSNEDKIFQIKNSENKSDHLMGERVKEIGSENEKEASNDQTDKKSTASVVNKSDKGIISVLDSNEPFDDIEQENMTRVKEYDHGQVESTKRSQKTARDSQTSSRKSSIYETESYKVLSDTIGAVDTGVGILKKSSKMEDEFSLEDRIFEKKLQKDSSLGRVPSVSDNEIYYSNSAVNGRRKRFRKKGRTKSRLTIRSKSENSERGYESSAVIDSGFEPSPRPAQRLIMSPRLNAYYQQRRSARLSGRSDSKIPVRKPGDKNAVDMRSVTQRIQTNMRRYYCERKIFQHLLELKRLQIRSSKTNESVLVKRAIDEYNKSSLSTVGLGPYSNPDYSFSSFEKFLYESLRKLQKSGKRHLDNLPEKPIDFDFGESELYKMSGIPDNPCLCTSKTHRCYHAVHAYTGIPCSAYIPYKWNHHTMPKPSTAGTVTKSKGFLPKINSKPPGKAHVTLEVSHGTERQLIALPAERLDKNKKYYVTFTVKGSEPPSDNDASPKSNKSVKSG